MKSIDAIYSKSKIDKAGDLLRMSDLDNKIFNESLDVLSNWRAYHANSLNAFAKVLRSRALKVSNNSNIIIAQRLKRTPSIISKLRRHKTMRLSAMQDIGGLRVVMNSIEEVSELLQIYKTTRSKHSLFSLNNYMDEPKKDGYRGLHLIYKIKKNPQIFLEIQFRSKLQHIWATSVEVFGTLKKSSFKSGFGEKKWLQFFVMLSSIFAIKEGASVARIHQDISREKLIEKTKKKIDELQVLENLIIFTSIYKRILDVDKRGRKGSYSLITLDTKSKNISVRRFRDNQLVDANAKYLELEKLFFENENKNVVLVNSGDIKKLVASYPNYLMDTKELSEILSLIKMDSFL